MQGQKYFILS